MRDEGYGSPFDEGGGFEPRPASEMPPAARRGLPWEQRDTIGPGAALLRTMSAVLFSPAAAFRDMKVEGGWGEPLGFAVLVGSVSSWIAQAWIMLANTMLIDAAGISPEEVAAANAQEIWSALLAPFLVLVFTVIGAGIAHLLMMLFGGAPRPYETTFRVFCYGWSVGAVNIVPVCGVFIGSVWRLVVEIIGLREAHPVPGGRAAAAVLVPVLVSCFCVVVVLILAVGLVGLAGLGEAGF